MTYSDRSNQLLIFTMNIQCFVSFIVLITFTSSVWCSEPERKLVTTLLENYTQFARPVEDASMPLTLEMVLTLKQIVDLDERNQILKTNVWIEYYWNDTNLTWKPEAYGNITDIRLPPSRLWKPDVLLYNSASQEFDTTYEVNVDVRHTGECKYGPPAIFESTCKIDITWFPFDVQKCYLKFGSWTYHSTGMDLKIQRDPYKQWNDSNSIYQYNHSNPFEKEGYPNYFPSFEEWYEGQGYKKSGEWLLVSFPAKRTVTSYTYATVQYYPDITYTIEIRRRTLYYWSNLILPCVVIASLTVLGFYYPPEAGEKVSLEITILMALTFFMQVVSDMQPPSSDIPIISKYFTFIMVMVACSVFCTILVLNYHHRLASNGAMPAVVQKVFLQWLPCLLRMSRNGEKITRSSIELQNKMEELKKLDTGSKSLLSNVLDKNDDYILPRHLQEIPSFNYASALHQSTGYLNDYGLDKDCPRHYIPPRGIHCEVQGCNGNITTAAHSVPPTRDPNSPPAKEAEYLMPFMEHTAILKKELEAILHEIQFLTDKYRDEAESSAIEDDWKFAAMVFDRFCLIAFTIFTAILSAAVFLIPDQVIVY